MKTNELYYQAPTEKVFKEVKEKSIEIWKTYDNEFGYVDEKVNRIKDLANVQDNVMYMVAMFDGNNQRILADKLSPVAKKAISDRVMAGGGFSNPFL